MSHKRYAIFWSHPRFGRSEYFTDNETVARALVADVRAQGMLDVHVLERTTTVDDVDWQ